MTNPPGPIFRGRYQRPRRRSYVVPVVMLFSVLGIAVAVIVLNREFLLSTIQRPLPVSSKSDSDPTSRELETANEIIDPKDSDDDASGGVPDDSTVDAVTEVLPLQKPEPKPKRVNREDVKDLDNVIHPGIGTNQLRVGESTTSVITLLGKPDNVIQRPIPLEALRFERTSDGSRGRSTNIFKYVDPKDWLVYKENGVAVVDKGGQIQSIVFRFRDRTYTSFDGTTDKGIGMWSTVGDVHRAYGKPEKVHKNHKVFEHDNTYDDNFFYILEYTSRRIEFRFKDGQLQSIDVWAP